MPNADHVAPHPPPDINFSTGSQFDLSFEQRPHHLTGLLFMYRNDRMTIVVFMRETEVRFSTFSISRTEPDQAANSLYYCSTRWSWKWTMEKAWSASLWVLKKLSAMGSFTSSKVRLVWKPTCWHGAGVPALLSYLFFSVLRKQRTPPRRWLNIEEESRTCRVTIKLISSALYWRYGCKKVKNKCFSF